MNFFGVKHSGWTKEEMVEIIGNLGGTANASSTRPDLFKMIHRRHNPRRILLWTINALGKKALAAASQGAKSQAQVREAAENATRERANLAKEERSAPKQEGVVPNDKPDLMRQLGAPH